MRYQKNVKRLGATFASNIAYWEYMYVTFLKFLNYLNHNGIANR